MARLLLLCMVVVAAPFLCITTARPIRELAATTTSGKVGMAEGRETDIAAPPSVSSVPEKGGEGGEAEAPENEVVEEGRHRPSDKSIAGGGVIIGGLVTATFATVFFYLRVTGKSSEEECKS